MFILQTYDPVHLKCLKKYKSMRFLSSVTSSLHLRRLIPPLYEVIACPIIYIVTISTLYRERALICYNYRTEPHMLQDQGLCKARASHNLRMELKETLHTVSNPTLR